MVMKNMPDAGGSMEDISDIDALDVDTVDFPSSWGDCVEATVVSDDPRLSGYKVFIVSDTTTFGSHGGSNRLVTMVVDLPRCILPEMNTHRVFSRNSASSRARSIRMTIGNVMEHPYVPIFTENQRGMSGGFLHGERLDKAVREWLNARDSAVVSELSLLLGDRYTGDVSSVRDDWNYWVDDYYNNVYHDEDTKSPSVHKQNANRLIEPFMWHEMLITSSYWDNFYKLRINDAAQPEMHLTARLMNAAMAESESRKSRYHIPFIKVDEDDLKPGSLEDAMMESATECARISYKDRSNMDIRNSSDLAEKMLRDGHMSPFEHQAVSATKGVSLRGTEGKEGLNGNLSKKWVQFRKVMEMRNHD